MDITGYALSKVTKWVVGYDLFTKISELVNGYFTDDTKSGSEKRSAVLEDLKDMGGDFTGFLVNFAIEVSVVLAKRALGIK